MAGKYELTFWGGTRVRYRRWHQSLDAAKETAQRVLGKMQDIGEPRAAHPAIIYEHPGIRTVAVVP